jgi:hypothetical protein
MLRLLLLLLLLQPTRVYSRTAPQPYLMRCFHELTAIPAAAAVAIAAAD